MYQQKPLKSYIKSKTKTEHNKNDICRIKQGLSFISFSLMSSL